MKKYFLSFLFILFALNLIQAQSIYVNSSYTGDEELGIIDKPYKTIQQAVDAAQEGDVVHIMAGTYREQVEIVTNNITIKNYENHKAIVSGTELVLEWEHVADEVYKAIVPWDIEENDESNQVFVNGEMIHLARWPKEISENWVTNPTMAVIDAAEGQGSVQITDEEFDEPSERWKDGMIWVNLANGHDGQGWTGIAGFVSSSLNLIKAEPAAGGSSIKAAEGYEPWAVQKGTKYYLFNPTSEGVYATGGPQVLLARGEWWKNGDTLFVRLPNGEKPASAAGEENIVEAKKRLWAFIPKEADQMANVTIKGLHIFAASITTDKLYNRANVAVNSHDNVIDSINARYITHFIDQTGHYQSQWYARTGIILSGVNNTIKNSIIKYSAGAAVSAFGENHKVIGNSIYEVNYRVTEAGAINSGAAVYWDNPEIAYNFIYNTPQKTISIGKMRSSDPETAGGIHIHHNVIMNFMLRNNDSGAMNGSASRNWDMMRIDHNIIANANTFLAIGIYTDFGGQAIIDHNLIWNVDRPIQMNRYSAPMGEIWVYNNTVIADSWSKPGIQNKHVNGSGEGMYYKNNIISNKINASLDLVETLESNLLIKKDDVNDLFVDYKNNDFRLKEGANNAIDMGVDASPYNDKIINDIPDIGAFEHGAEPWKAGPEGVVTGLKIDKDKDMIQNGDTVHFEAIAYTHGIFEMEPQPELYWWTNGCGTIDEKGIFTAEQITDDAKIYVTADSLLIESIEFSIEDKVSSVEETKWEDYDRNSKHLMIKSFPNPVSNNLHVQLWKAKPGNHKTEVKIYSTALKMVYSKAINAVNGYNEFNINTESFHSGFYLMEINCAGKKAYSKIIVQ